MRLAVAALALLALASGCGSLSREADVARAVRDDKDVDLRPLRGSDPMLAELWYISATEAKTPEDALALVDRGLTFLPGQPDLTSLRLALLAQLDRRQDEVAAATLALGNPGPASGYGQYLSFRIDGHLALDDPFAAAADVVDLGSVQDVEPELVASAWAAVALAYEVTGHPDEADEAVDRSLALGGRGLYTLRQQTAQQPEHSAAASALVTRANERHPAHPDVQLYLAVDAMLAKDLSAAQALLDGLQEPVPGRLVADREALRARLDLLQGRSVQAVQRLLARLDEYPSETGTLAVLIECWHTQGVPSDAVLHDRLVAAYAGIDDPNFAKAVQATLAELKRRRAPAPAPAPPAQPPAQPPAAEPPPGTAPAR